MKTAILTAIMFAQIVHAQDKFICPTNAPDNPVWVRIKIGDCHYCIGQKFDRTNWLHMARDLGLTVGLNTLGNMYAPQHAGAIRTITSIAVIGHSISLEIKQARRTYLDVLDITGGLIGWYTGNEISKRLLSSSPPKVSPRRQGSSTAKWLYAGAVVLSLAHMGIVDALMWEPDKESLPEFARSDYIYLGGTLFALTATATAAWHWQPHTFAEFATTTAGAILVGSLAWDWIFGTLRYGDPLHPFPDWFAGWGFNDKGQRVVFDLTRAFTAAGLFILSERQAKINILPIITPDQSIITAKIAF